MAAGVIRAIWQKPASRDREIPFYSTAPGDLASAATDLVRQYNCRQCHSLWTMRDPLQAVPAPMLDGIGSLRTEAWLFDYLSAANPQSILPSRLKPEYRMPSYAGLSDAQRRTLARYLASLRVKDWYLEQTRRLEHDKLTGEDTAEK
ncbi:MAG TPA: cytochrome c [Burkholderiaceae bacterium]|nr:cytochrome c [Burkholderiaceae bacterium]